MRKLQTAAKAQSCPGLPFSGQVLSNGIACLGEGRKLSVGTVSWARTKNHIGNAYTYKENVLTYNSAPRVGFGHWLTRFSRRCGSPPAPRERLGRYGQGYTHPCPNSMSSLIGNPAVSVSVQGLTQTQLGDSPINL